MGVGGTKACKHARTHVVCTRASCPSLVNLLLRGLGFLKLCALQEATKVCRKEEETKKKKTRAWHCEVCRVFACLSFVGPFRSCLVVAVALAVLCFQV